MPIYVLRQDTVESEPPRLCVALAGDEQDAKYRAELEHGGDWEVVEPQSTLEEIKDMAEDSESQTVMLNVTDGTR